MDVLATGVLGDLLLDFIVKIDAVHLSQREQVERHVGQFLSEIGLNSAPRLETFRDLALQQHELQQDIAGVEPFGDLVLPGELLSFPDLQRSSAETTGVVAYNHLHEAEYLAEQDAEWSADDRDRARMVIGDLALVLRRLLGDHGLHSNGNCRTCPWPWPCPVVRTIHAVVKDPQRQFAALVQRARDDE